VGVLISRRAFEISDADAVCTGFAKYRQTVERDMRKCTLIEAQAEHIKNATEPEDRNNNQALLRYRNLPIFTSGANKDNDLTACTRISPMPPTQLGCSMHSGERVGSRGPTAPLLFIRNLLPGALLANKSC
jgi:hypothetical protein